MYRDYQRATQIINEIVESVPDYCKGDELKTFTYIYVTIAQRLRYNDYAAELIGRKLVGYERERAEDSVIQPASTIECLIWGRALCTGYAEVLKAILERLKIPTIIVRTKGDHAWNQVKINGKWYNCDLTNDADFILDGLKCPHFLTSNEDDYNFHVRYPTSYFENCNETISEELQEQLIKEADDFIKLEKRKKQIKLEEEAIEEKPGFIKRLFSHFKSKEGGKRI